jgi:tetratricopeptide (TPR) repeat protein
VSYGLVIVVGAAAWVVRRRWPGVTAALTAFFLTMLPMLGVVQNGPQIAADRYTYHAAPILGLLVGAVWAHWRGPRLSVRLAATGGILTALGAATWHQSSYWRTSEQLWARVLAVDSTSSIAQIAMGDLLIAQGRAGEAAVHYGRGVQFDPDYAEGHNNLGVALARGGRVADAVDHYRQAIAIDSTYVDARVNLGNALLRLGRPRQALENFEAAERLRPGNADTHFNWGVCLAQLERFGEAADQFRTVLRLDPANGDAQTYLQRAEQMQKARAATTTSKR